MSSAPDEQPVRVRNAAELRRILADAGVDTRLWGVGTAKTVEQLLEELHEGSSHLSTDEEGLFRLVRPVWVDVFAGRGAGRRHLVERRQVLSDGRIRERGLPASLGEKCMIGEDPVDAAHRGIAEELGISSPVALSAGESRGHRDESMSYPTLRTRYESHWFVAELDAADYRAEGYVEIQPDKRSYFDWEP